MRILIGVPPSVFPATGPAYVAAMLKREGHQVVGHVLQGSWQFRGMVHNGQYDLVMSGGVSSQLGEIRSMLDIARQEGVTTVVGGGIVSAEPELMTREINPDYAILGQGEVTAVELVISSGSALT